MMSRTIVLCLFLAPTAAADVLIVDAAGGGDFTSIEAAYAQAFDGDVLLIRPGNYSSSGDSITLEGKGVTLAAESTPPWIAGSLRVEDIPEGSRMHLFRLQQRDLVVQDCAGSVRIESCDTFRSAGVSNSHDVVFMSCSLLGKDGSTEDGFGTPGRDGLGLTQARVGLYDCTLTGGDGGDGDDFAFVGIGCPAPGGMGLNASASVIYALNSVFQGGRGGNADTCTCIGYIIDGAPGGGGAIGTNGTVMHMTAIPSIQGGQGGGPSGCQGIDGAAHTPIDFLGLPRRALVLPDLVREGDSTQWTILGRPGDRVFLASSTQGDWRYLPSANGLLGLGFEGPPSVTFLGVIDSTSTLEMPVTVPVLPAGVEAEVTDYQIFVLAADETRILGSLAPQLVLQAGF